MQRVAAPILPIRPAFQQTLFLQIVHQGHEPARERSQSSRKCLLCNAGCRGEKSHDTSVGRSQFKFAEAVGKLTGCMRPYLRHKEGWGGTSSGFMAPSPFHRCIVAQTDCSMIELFRT